MLNRILIAVVAVVAIVKAFAPNLEDGGALAIILVLAGLVYGATAVDAEDATNFLVVAVAASVAAGANALDAIPQIGGYLDGIIDHISTALTAAIASILAVRTVNRLKG